MTIHFSMKLNHSAMVIPNIFSVFLHEYFCLCKSAPWVIVVTLHVKWEMTNKMHQEKSYMHLHKQKISTKLFYIAKTKQNTCTHTHRQRQRQNEKERKKERKRSTFSDLLTVDPHLFHRNNFVSLFPAFRYFPTNSTILACTI